MSAAPRTTLHKLAYLAVRPRLAYQVIWRHRLANRTWRARFAQAAFRRIEAAVIARGANLIIGAIGWRFRPWPRSGAGAVLEQMVWLAMAVWRIVSRLLSGLMPVPERLRPPYPTNLPYSLGARLRLGRERRAAYLDRVAQNLFALGLADRALYFSKWSRRISPNGDRHHRVLRNLLAASGDVNEIFLEESKAWSDLYEPPAPSRAFPLFSPHRALRVGLVCDYLNSVIGRFTVQPQLRQYDSGRIKFFIYDLGPGSWLTRKISPQYRQLKNMPPERMHDIIRGDGIDILIDMNGWLRPTHTFDILKRRPAPIQVSWYNLPATAGIRAIDYVLSDEVAAPPELDKYFTEKVIRLEGGATGGWTLPEEPAIADLPARRKGFFTFGCFGDMFKLTPQLLDAWASILHRVPRSQLYVKNGQLDQPLLRVYLTRQMAKRGISPARLRLEGISSYGVMRELYGEMDVALDTFPFSGGSTTINALWQGVPTVCLAGPEWRGRSSASIVMSTGLEDYFATSAQDYVDKAVAAADDLTTLAEIRRTMRQRLLDRTHYFRMDRFAAAFENALYRIRDDYVATLRTDQRTENQVIV